MSIAGGLYRALLRGREAGCEVIQIFTRNRNRWKSKKLSAKEIDLFHKVCDETSIVPVAAHNSYLINLASPDEELWLNMVGTFGVASAGYWRGRAGAAIVRLSHYALGFDDAGLVRCFAKKL